MEQGTLNSLNDVYKHHCNGEALDKGTRDIFVKGTIKEISDNFQVSNSNYSLLLQLAETPRGTRLYSYCERRYFGDLPIITILGTFRNAMFSMALYVTVSVIIIAA